MPQSRSFALLCPTAKMAGGTNHHFSVLGSTFGVHSMSSFEPLKIGKKTRLDAKTPWTWGVKKRPLASRRRRRARLAKKSRLAGRPTSAAATPKSLVAVIAALSGDWPQKWLCTLV